MKRNTNQKKAIEEVFEQYSGPLSLQDILRYGRERVPTLNQATVYRHLKILLEQEWLLRVYNPGGNALYERAGRAHHHYFFCRKCEAAYELPGCGLKVETDAPEGFAVEGHEMFFTGVCAKCGGKGE